MQNYLALTTLLVFTSTVLFSQNELEKLNSLYAQFEYDIKNKDVNSFEKLFYNNEVPLNTIIRTPDSINHLSNTFNNWANFLRTATFPYEIRISNSKFTVNGQVAFSLADYHEYAKGELVSIGKDLFLYLKNNNKWQFASLNGTATLVSNDNENCCPSLHNKMIKKVLERVFHHKTRKGKNSPANQLSKHAQVYYKDSIEGKNWKSKSLSSYFKAGQPFKKQRILDIKIYDQHIALAKVELIPMGTQQILEGYAVLVATNKEHPLITSLIIS